MSERKIPAGIEQLLGMAAVDEAFAAELLKRREAVIESGDVQLAPTERALLASIDGAALEAMIAGVRKNLPDGERRAFLSMAANVALGLAASGAVASSLGGCIDRCIPTKGIQPDRPKPQVPDSAGVRPDRPPQPDPQPAGIRPDRPASQPIRGSGGARADRPPKPVRDHRSVGKGGVRADRPKKNIFDEK